MELSLPENFQVQDAPQVLERARPALDLPPDAQVRVENVRKTSRGTRITFSYTHAVKIENQELCDAQDICVEVSSYGDLRFNARGILVTCNVKPTEPEQVRAISDHLNKLVAGGHVYVAKRGEHVDLEQLREQGKSWYLEEDAQGNRKLKRAWIA
ncbi:MAG: hypothetical protein IT331_08750 [Anaerolineae bacterium]|nr:hypothetical protein [Anaerolineae bacterium]